MHRAAMVTTLLPAQPKPANVRNVCDPILLDEVQAGRREHDVKAYLERSPNRVNPRSQRQHITRAYHHAKPDPKRCVKVNDIWHGRVVVLGLVEQMVLEVTTNQGACTQAQTNPSAGRPRLLG